MVTEANQQLIASIQGCYLFFFLSDSPKECVAEQEKFFFCVGCEFLHAFIYIHESKGLSFRCAHLRKVIVRNRECVCWKRKPISILLLI